MPHGLDSLPGGGHSMSDRHHAMPAIGIDLSADRYGMPGSADGLSTAGHDLSIAGGNNLPARENTVPGDSDGLSGGKDGLSAAAGWNGLHSGRRQRLHVATRAAGAGQSRRDTSAQWADPLAAAGSVASLNLLS